MTWFCCDSPRKRTFKFEHGTMVEETDSTRAIELLRSISLKNVKVSNIDDGNWIGEFHPNVFIELKAPDQVQARRAAEWFAYLDHRELQIVHPR